MTHSWLRRCLPGLLLAVIVGGRSGPQPQSTTTGTPNPSESIQAFHGLGKLAYVRDGRLYILNGEIDVLQEVEGAAPASGPAWSADGNWLAFRRAEGDDSRVMLAEAATGRVRAIKGVPGTVTGYAWAPTGRSLAVSVITAGQAGPGPGEIWLVDDPAKPEARRLVSTDTAMGSLIWSPDSSRIAYVTTLPSQDLPTRSDALEVVPLPGGSPTRWYLTPQSGIDLAGWWPDGQGILFWVRPMHCNSCAADGLPLQSLALGSAEPKQQPDMLLNRRWLSWGDGRDLLIVRGGGRPGWDNKSLAVCDVSSAACRDLPQSQDVVSLDPAWSPDGSQIAFVRAARRPGEWGFATDEQLEDWIGSRSLWLIAPDGSSPKEIQAAGRGIYGPAWARDSRHLLYVKDGAVWVLALDQPKPERLVTLAEPQDRFGFYGQVSHALAWHRSR